MSFQPTYSSSTNRMTSLPGFTPSYDANGNVLNDNSHAYVWDAENRPVNQDGIGFTIDALNRVVEQNRSGAYTQIVYAPTGEKLALMSGQTLQKAFIPLPGRATAVYTSSGLSYYRHPDWLGSARFGSTPSRTMYFDAAYAPFGEPYAQAGTTDLSFTGINQDTDSDSFDFPARQYSTQGRWASPDPAGLAAVDPSFPQSWNRYAYVMNNPLSFTDPTGLVCTWWDKTHDDPVWDGGAGQFECETQGGTWKCDPGAICVTSRGGGDSGGFSPCALPGSCGGRVGDTPIGPAQDGPGGGGGNSWLVPPVGRTTIGPGDPDARKKYCSHQSDLAALEDLLPGITRGEYVSTAAKIGAETGAHLALEGAAASSILKRAIRARTGIAMSTTSKILGRAATALLVLTGYEALRAAQDEYQACMNY